MTRTILLSNEGQIDKLDDWITDNSVILELNRVMGCPHKTIHYSKVIDNYNSWRECTYLAANAFQHWHRSNITPNPLRNIIYTNSSNFLSSHDELLTKVIYMYGIIDSIIDEICPSEIITLSPIGDWERVAEVACMENDVGFSNTLDNSERLLKNLGNNCFNTGDMSGSEFNISAPFQIIPLIYVLKIFSDLIQSGDWQSTNFRNVDVAMYIENDKWVRTMEPVFEILSSDFSMDLFLLTGGSNYLTDKLPKDNQRSLNEYSCGSTVLSVAARYYTILWQYLSIFSTGDFTEGMSNMFGEGVKDLLSRRIKETVYFSYSELNIEEQFREVISKHSPKCVVMPHYATSQAKSINSICGDYDIPTINYVGGAAWGNPTSQYSSCNADKILVPGKVLRQRFIDYGMSPDKVVETGSPRFKTLQNKLARDDEIKRKYKKELGIDQTTYVVTYLTQSFNTYYGAKDRINEATAIINSMTGIDDCHLLIKVHPSESNIGVYNDIASDCGLSDYSILRSDLHESLIAADTAIVKESSTGFEALLSNCNLIVTDISGGKIEYTPYNHQSPALLVNNEYELKKTLRKLRSCNSISGCDPDIIQFISKYYGDIDSNPSKAIAQIIVDEVDTT
ncbi:hypothetical protein [Natronomonas sp. EA1]|uniref:hypothetical protein n=1 Tax=Natronomonas sp. EA1 TaxID=3421655 RepID=UPI003EBCADB3